MPAVSIGDMSQHFRSLRNSGAIKTDLAKLNQELSTGMVEDITAHLDGDTRQLSGVSHSLKVIEAYKQSSNETALLLEHAQHALSRVDDIRSRTSQNLLTVSPSSQPLQMEQASLSARAAFSEIVSAANITLAGRSIFGGSVVEFPPLIDADLMLSDIVGTIGANSSASAIIQAVDDWFESPSGGFTTFAYQGETGAVQNRMIRADQSISLSFRADDPGFRKALKSTALAAILPNVSAALSREVQGGILQKAGVELLATSAEAANMQSVVGYLQETVAAAQARMSSEQASLNVAHNNLTLADPFETATRLDAIQIQLETHFTVTSRLSRLSLLEYI